MVSSSWHLSSVPLFSQTLQRRRRLRWTVGPLLLLAVAIIVGLSLVPPLPAPPAAPPDQARPSKASSAAVTLHAPVGTAISAVVIDPPPPGETQGSVVTPAFEANAAAASGTAADSLARATGQPPPSEDVTRAAAEVRQALQAWADSWSRRDFSGYAAAYAPGFKGTYGSHAEWRSQRQARIVSRQRIEVRLSQVVVAVDGARAKVEFRQEYVSDAWQDDTRRTMEWQRSGDRWLIAAESDR